jgi:putative aldouronate transport system permease protein
MQSVTSSSSTAARTTTGATPRRMARRSSSLNSNRSLLLMCVPALLLLLVFNYLPLPGILIAFKNYKFNLGIWGSSWVGLKNFEYLFASGVAARILTHTILYNLLFIVSNLVVSLGLALLFNEVRSRTMARIYQSTVFFPYFISWVIAGYFAFALLSTDVGLLNRLLQQVGIEPVSWLRTPWVWPFILVFANLWKSAGYTSLIYLAAMMGISAEFYEAAEIDGATRWQQIWSITLPMIAPVIIIMVILSIGRILNADFGLFFYLTRGVSGDVATTVDVIDTYVYNALRNSSDLGMPAAAGLFQSMVGFFLVLSTNLVIRRVDAERALF